jgi:ERF superfamily
VNVSSAEVAAVATALIAAQREFAPAIKSAENPHFKSKYVPLDAVLDAVGGSLREHGLALVSQTWVDGDDTLLTTRIIHAASGEWLGATLPIDPTQPTPQAVGSAITYARRYTTMSLLGIAPEDDDGEAASKPADDGKTTRQRRTEARAMSAADVDDLAHRISLAGNLEELRTLWTEGSSVLDRNVPMTGQTISDLIEARRQELS